MDKGREGRVEKEREGRKSERRREDGRGCKCRNAHTNSGFTYEARSLNVEEK